MWNDGVEVFMLLWCLLCVADDAKGHPAGPPCNTWKPGVCLCRPRGFPEKKPCARSYRGVDISAQLSRGEREGCRSSLRTIPFRKVVSTN